MFRLIEKMANALVDESFYVGKLVFDPPTHVPFLYRPWVALNRAMFKANTRMMEKAGLPALDTELVKAWYSDSDEMPRGDQLNH